MILLVFSIVITHGGEDLLEILLNRNVLVTLFQIGVVLDSGYPWGVRNICNLNKVSLCRLVCGTRERERA